MKKICVVFLCLLLVGSLSESVLAKSLNVGVAWTGKSGMSNRVLAGFEAQLKEVAPSARLEMHKELESMEDLAKVVEKFQAEKDGMVILRSNGAEWLGKNPPTIPTFIGGCNNPTQLGAVKNMSAPEGNITGVTYYLPADTQFEVFKALLSRLDSVLLLMEKGHPSSAIDEKDTRAACAKFGVKYTGVLCANDDEILAAVRGAVGKVSAMIIGNQGLVLDATPKIVEAAGKTPVLAYTAAPVKQGALGGMVADDDRLGRMLAESLAEVLVKGKAVRDVPVKMDPKPTFYINAKTAERIGIEVPFSVLETAKIIE